MLSIYLFTISFIYSCTSGWPFDRSLHNFLKEIVLLKPLVSDHSLPRPCEDEVAEEIRGARRAIPIVSV